MIRSRSSYHTEHRAKRGEGEMATHLKSRRGELGLICPIVQGVRGI
jgi:hypothetical protein